MTVVITCTSFPLQAFAPAVAYAATPTAAELSEKNADKARAELLTAIGADLPGLYEDDNQQSLADATSRNTAWGCLYGFVNPSRESRHAAARPAGAGALPYGLERA